MESNHQNWDPIQSHFGYTDDEMKMFKQSQRNLDVLAKAPRLMNITIVAEVVESHGCNSRHKQGDRFYFDGAGNLITKLAPKRVCVYALCSLASLIFASNELIYAGIDANEMRFRRAGCFDVGVHCGGWGRVVMELRIQDREEASNK